MKACSEFVAVLVQPVVVECQRWVPPVRAILLAIGLIAAASVSRADMLETPSYRITIGSRCSEGDVTCDDVTYVGVSKKTGATIKLTGRTVHAIGADGVTPSHFLGYEFKNGKTTYFVGWDELIVTRGSKVLVYETGVWKESSERHR